MFVTTKVAWSRFDTIGNAVHGLAFLLTPLAATIQTQAASAVHRRAWAASRASLCIAERHPALSAHLSSPLLRSALSAPLVRALSLAARLGPRLCCCALRLCSSALRFSRCAPLFLLASSLLPPLSPPPPPRPVVRLDTAAVGCWAWRPRTTRRSPLKPVCSRRSLHEDSH